jgi:tetratricopeptide (TPR) repeat protein
MSLRFLLLLTVLCQAQTFDEVAALAAAAGRANDIPKAIQLYKQAVELNPKWQEGWWFLGTFLYGSSKYAPARDAYQHVVELNPQMAPAWGLLSLCEFQTAEYRRSLEHTQRSLTLGAGKEPQLGEVLRYHEAVLLAKVGNFDTAIEKYAPFLREAAPGQDLTNAFGIAVLRLPIVPSEIAEGQRDLIAAAGNAASLAIRGDPRTTPAFSEFLARFPKSRGVHYLYGTQLLQSDQPGAMKEFERELEISPASAAAESMLALGFSMRGDTAGALHLAEKAVKDDPSSSMAHYVLGRVLAKAGQMDRGIQHLEIAVKIDPGSVENHTELATVYPKAGRYQDAKKERMRVLELLKENDAHP